MKFQTVLAFIENLSPGNVNRSFFCFPHTALYYISVVVGLQLPHNDRPQLSRCGSFSIFSKCNRYVHILVFIELYIFGIVFISCYI